jgi:hypothetical protein
LLQSVKFVYAKKVSNEMSSLDMAPSIDIAYTFI